jgi:peptide/nickel transport system substrate-binding protein
VNRRIFSLLVLAMLVVAAPAASAPGQTPKRGGTLVMGSLREPACINAYLRRCHLSTPPAGFLMGVALRGAFRASPGLTLVPDLVSSADYTTRPRFTLTYRIRPSARWSDGVPITASDFVFTHRALRSVWDELSPEDRALFGRVRAVRAVGRRTVEVVLDSRFSGWRVLFRYVLPAHALRGADFSNVWLDGLEDPRTGRAIASGPFVIERWDRGRTITFRRNPRYSGSHRAFLDAILFRFCKRCDGTELVEWLRAGEIDYATGPFLTAANARELQGMSGISMLAGPGSQWEHLDLRIGRGGHPGLRKRLVRRAIAYGIDRRTIARELSEQSGVRYLTMQSLVFVTYDRHYRPNWSRYAYRPTRARRLLEQAGCERGGDGIYSCDGARLSLRFVTTAGSQHRERIVELAASQLRTAGIEVIPEYTPGLTVFNEILPAGTFHVALFAWIRGAFDLPSTFESLYTCNGSQNYAAYCQQLVTRNLRRVARMVNPVRQARALNEADAQLARDVPVLPLVQNPLVRAFRSGIRNVVVTGHVDPFENAENWWQDD